MSHAESLFVAHSPEILACNSTPTSNEFHVTDVSQRKKLVLDLDETLIHSSFYQPTSFDFTVNIVFQGYPYDIYVKKRPGVDRFLETLNQRFNIYIFTASLEEYSLPVIKALIHDFPEEKVLSRKHCKCMNGSFIKDLSIFKCDLSQILIVDNSTVSYCLQPQNGITISTWTGDDCDSELNERILPILLKCYNSDDIRRTIAMTKKGFFI